ncbi:hypothetical protein [Rhizobium alvei]|uniref:Uncharacterized protein n=1 Tax=Rhizobium alvei TaxID=1132659 RepID=A0ABT8YQG6_9HYPH|nr:hypothetical protein [Rhizobium alvei]MDO6965952.1 hypothetical protein [Rhizobium alvei]
MKPLLSLSAALAFSTLMMTSAMAEPPKPDVKALITEAVIKDIQGFLKNDIVTVAIDAQNKRLSKLTQAEIDAADKQWVEEREADDKPLIAATLSNPLSVYLNRIQGRSLGLYAEIFIMDQNGLNVGQSSITKDFWQGDEDKFQKTFQVSKDAIFIDEAEWDDEAKIWRAQVNFTLTDPSGATPIGAATVELNLTELARRASS